MDRIPEPELMDDAAQVAAYANADFTQPNSDFIQRLKTFINNPSFSGNALDLGCGPGDISRRFAYAFPLSQIDAVDGSLPMIDAAISSTDQTLLTTRLKFIHGTLPEANLPKTRYDIIYSNSLLHHLVNPQIAWGVIKKYAKPGTKVGVMDLLRPDSPQQAQHLVATYANNEPEILKRDFYNSLLAAFTLTEIKHQINDAQLDFAISQISDRHVFISGIMP